MDAEECYRDTHDELDGETILLLSQHIPWRPEP